MTASNLSAVKVFPNPWRADRPIDGIHFENLTGNCTVKIFTLSGHWVQTLIPANGEVTWNLRNNSGDRIASGLYIYLVTDDRGGKVHGTLGVVR